MKLSNVFLTIFAILIVANNSLAQFSPKRSDYIFKASSINIYDNNAKKGETVDLVATIAINDKKFSLDTGRYYEYVGGRLINTGWQYLGDAIDDRGARCGIEIFPNDFRYVTTIVIRYSDMTVTYLGKIIDNPYY